MADFNIRSDSVDVEQIMKQIRARLKEKRGVDYTEEQVRELATVRLEKFLDPKNLRSDLLEQFRKSRPAPPVIPADPPPLEPPYVFDDQTLVASHRGWMRFVRRLLRPVLTLMFNPNTLNQILHTQAQFNVDMMKRDQRRKIEMQIFDRARGEWNVLYYEVLHNLVLETTRNGIELKNLKMRVEALASRLDFSERRVRALEGVVQYRPEAVRPRSSALREPARGDRSARSDGDIANGESGEGADSSAPEGASALGGPVQAVNVESSGRRRRRRRRGRRGTGPFPGVTAAPIEPQTEPDGPGGDDEFETVDEIEAGPDDSGAFEVQAADAPAVDEGPSGPEQRDLSGRENGSADQESGDAAAGEPSTRPGDGSLDPDQQ